MSKIFFVTGKSCSGKDTIFQRIKEMEGLGLKTVVGYTTRPMRAGEENGKEYFFVDCDRLEHLWQEGKVIECRGYQTVHGLWNYFTVNDGQIDLESGNYLYIGTLESYEKFVKYYGKEHVVPIYVEVENGERLERAVKRERKQKEPKYAELCRRFLADEQDFQEENIIRAGIQKRYQNINLEDCIDEIVRDIQDVTVQDNIGYKFSHGGSGLES